MSVDRKITGSLTSKPTMEGAGVRLKRVFGYSETSRVDPFLLLDDFGSENPDDYMAGFPIPNDQYEKYVTSVHGQALLVRGDIGAPACNDCHGNHGAIPPGTSSLSHVCGVCHALNADLFQKSPHAKAFERQDLHQCIVCHGHHAIAPPSPRMFNMEADSPCITCHHQNDAGWDMGKKMYPLVDELNHLRDKAQTTLDEAQDYGMDASEGRFLLQDFRKNFLQMRTLSHNLNFEEYSAKAHEAKNQAERALIVAESAIGEFYFRRKGLLISLLMCLPVILLLYLKIRQLDTTKREGQDGYQHRP